MVPLIATEASDLTVDWLNAVLAAAGVPAVAHELRVSRLGEGQMGSCYRLSVSYQEGAGPARLVAKLASTDPAVRAGAAMAYLAEVGFYRNIAGRLPVSVPRSYFAESSEDGTSFTILLEDMSPAEAGDQLAGCTPEQARAAAVAVAGLHGASWCDDSFKAHGWLIPSMSEYAEHMGPMLAEAGEGFLSRRDLDSATSHVITQFTQRFGDWAAGSGASWSLLHNDYRLDNLLFASPGSGRPPVSIVDWQSLSTGQPLRDVAYLVGTGMEPDARRAHEREIVAAYHGALCAQGVTGYDADRCWEDYRHGLFQGPLICLLGEHVAARTDRGLKMFSVMAERSAAAILELDCLDLLDLPR